jgi:quercetin 2,3-dioxygenase
MTVCSTPPAGLRAGDPDASGKNKAMSGPVSVEDVAEGTEPSEPAPGRVEVIQSRRAQVGEFRVQRALPRRAHRTVGSWCFVDHLGPANVRVDQGLDVAPHPHIGLQTVTWLLAGEVLHRDSLGSEQVIRPGQLNLMTAGHGVAHSEERTGQYAGDLHGVQLWVAQPSATRHETAAFEHHPELPRVDLRGATATVLVGDLDGAVSPARRDTQHIGVDLELESSSTVPLHPGCEYAVVVLTGAVEVDGTIVRPGHLAYLGEGREECGLAAAREPARCLLFGGPPFPEPVTMWWNFVARTRDEITAAHQDWVRSTARFGHVASTLPRLEVDPPPWATP